MFPKTSRVAGVNAAVWMLIFLFLFLASDASRALLHGHWQGRSFHGYIETFGDGYAVLDADPWPSDRIPQIVGEIDQSMILKAMDSRS